MSNPNPELTPEQSLQILRAFVSHPNVRCFNASEYQHAFQALLCLEQEIKDEDANKNPE